jgi:N6-L-threonylcarbamoyladenine synthase
VAEVVRERCARAIDEFGKIQGNQARPVLVVSGGVAANKRIRAALQDLAYSKSMEFVAPPLNLCSDNGAMIAWTGIERLKKNMIDTLDVAARPRWPLDPAAEKKSKQG